MKKKKKFCIIWLIAFLISNTNAYAHKAKQQAFFITSIPKAGTNLLRKLLEMITDKKGTYQNTLNIEDGKFNTITDDTFLVFHCFYKPSDCNYIIEKNLNGFFIYRDPRDQIISRINYIRSTPSHTLHQTFKEKSISELIFFCTEKINVYYQCRLGWYNCEHIYSTTFEKLVGSKGGGSDEQQQIEIFNIANHLGIKLSSTQIAELSRNLFGGTGTFNKGQIGNWKNYFNQEHIDYFKKVAGSLLIELGYEKDFNW